MKKILCALVLSAALMVASSPALSQAAREATIEPDTKVRAVLQTPLNSKLNEVGDTIIAVLYEPVYVNGQLVLPRGTEFQGRVTMVTSARRAMKSGRMAILFDRINMPWGQESAAISITSVDDWNQDKKYKADEEGQVNGGKDGKKTAENVRTGAEIGLAGGTATILLANGSKGGAIAGGAGIAGALVASLFLTKGGEVKLAPGAIFRIRFDRPITLPVIRQSSAAPQPIQQEDKETQPKKP
jgi:hypothetical protein